MAESVLVFISHSSEDKEGLVEPIVEDLERCYIRTWLDTKEIAPGDNLRKSILKDGLEKADIVLVSLKTQLVENKPKVYKEFEAILDTQRISDFFVKQDELLKNSSILFRSDTVALRLGLVQPQRQEKPYAERYLSYFRAVLTELGREFIKWLTLTKTKTELDQIMKKAQENEFEFILSEPSIVLPLLMNWDDLVKSGQAKVKFVWDSAPEGLVDSALLSRVAMDVTYKIGLTNYGKLFLHWLIQRKTREEIKELENNYFTLERSIVEKDNTDTE